MIPVRIVDPAPIRNKIQAAVLGLLIPNVQIALTFLQYMNKITSNGNKLRLNVLIKERFLLSLQVIVINNVFTI